MRRRPPNFTTEEVRAEEGNFIKDEEREILERINTAISKVNRSSIMHHSAATNNKHGFRGIIKFKTKQHHKRSWAAEIGIKGKVKYLGSYPTKEEAARAYDKAAKIIHGRLAVLNFPDE